MTLWLLVLGLAGRALFSARCSLRASGDAPEIAPLLVRAIGLSLLVLIAYMTYGNVELRKGIWLILGLSIGVQQLAVRAPTRLTSSAHSPQVEPVGAEGLRSIAEQTRT